MVDRPAELPRRRARSRALAAMGVRPAGETHRGQAPQGGDGHRRHRGRLPSRDGARTPEGPAAVTTTVGYAWQTVEPLLAIAVCAYLAVVALMSLAFWDPPDPR